MGLGLYSLKGWEVTIPTCSLAHVCLCRAIQPCSLTQGLCIRISGVTKEEWGTVAASLEWNEGTGIIGVMCLSFPGGSTGTKSACNAWDLGSKPGLGRSAGEGRGYPLHYPGLENSLGYTVHGGHKELDTTEQLALSNGLDVHISSFWNRLLKNSSHTVKALSKLRSTLGASLVAQR